MSSEQRVIGPAAYKVLMAERQRRIMRLLAAGHTHDEIAAELDLTISTVKADLARIKARANEETYSVQIARREAQGRLIDELKRTWAPKALGTGDGVADLRASEYLLKVLEREARLYGLDAPLVSLEELARQMARDNGLDPELVVRLALQGAGRLSGASAKTVDAPSVVMLPPGE